MIRLSFRTFARFGLIVTLLLTMVQALTLPRSEAQFKTWLALRSPMAKVFSCLGTFEEIRRKETFNSLEALDTFARQPDGDNLNPKLLRVALENLANPDWTAVRVFLNSHSEFTLEQLLLRVKKDLTRGDHDLIRKFARAMIDRSYEDSVSSTTGPWNLADVFLNIRSALPAYLITSGFDPFRFSQIESLTAGENAKRIIEGMVGTVESKDRSTEEFRSFGRFFVEWLILSQSKPELPGSVSKEHVMRLFNALKVNLQGSAYIIVHVILNRVLEDISKSPNAVCDPSQLTAIGTYLEKSNAHFDQTIQPVLRMSEVTKDLQVAFALFPTSDFKKAKIEAMLKWKDMPNRDLHRFLRQMHYLLVDSNPKK